MMAFCTVLMVAFCTIGVACFSRVPEFFSPWSNVTGLSGSTAELPCSVKNLGKFYTVRLSIDQSIILLMIQLLTMIMILVLLILTAHDPAYKPADAPDDDHDSDYAYCSAHDLSDVLLMPPNRCSCY